VGGAKDAAVQLAAVLALAVAAAHVGACAGPFGRSPLVLTEIPNRPSGRALIALGAERSHCRVTSDGEARMVVSCAEGEIVVPTFPGPPTFAVQCTDARLQDVSLCSALVRKVLMASEGSGP